MLIRFIYLISFCVITLFHSNTSQAKTLNTTSPQISLPQIELYLNNLKTVKSDFLQTANDGTQLEGQFFLKRPGKLRFQYAPPLKDFIVADGLFIYFYDAEMEQQSHTTIGNSLADFILRKNIKLSGDVRVSDYKMAGGLLQVTLRSAEDPESGSLTLGFQPKPLELKKWRVVDAQGYVTEIELLNLKKDLKLNNKLFHYIDPKRLRPQYN